MSVFGSGSETARVHPFVHASACDLQPSELSVVTASSVRNGCVRLTEDIGGMSFLGQRLQLIVTPAILSVAVPCVLHHLQ